MEVAATGFFATLFLFSGIWFWVIALAAFGVLVALADKEMNFWAAALTGSVLAGSLYFNQVTIDWSTVLYITVAYLFLGVIMSFIKWILYLKRRASKYVELKLSWYKKVKGANPDMPTITKTTDMRAVLEEDAFANFQAYLQQEYFINSKERRIIPAWQDKKGKLVSWALWWPAVIFWALLNDFILHAFEIIVTALREKYDAIAMKVFGNVGVGEDGDEDAYNKYDRHA